MSIGPIQSFPPAESMQAVNPSVGSSRAEPRPDSGTAAEKAAQPVSGTLPKQETSIAKNVPSTYELPADVVEVHQDPETKNQIIIQYLDKGRNVVLQVPSNQELSVERGISQDFQQAAKLRASADTATANDEGGKTHGD
ncbi:MAG: hypothetical protein ABSD76_14950 [Terriglobales bacterium]|jgi:hypothetical protein